MTPRTTSSSIRHLERQYGPIAFGLVALLALWFAIIAPEREAMRRSVESTASTFAKAATLLDATSTRLERIELRWENSR